jgi:hypothetical protein
MTLPDSPNSGRVIDYLLGGTHHFPPDIAGGDRMLASYSGYPGIFRDVRGFFGKAARYMHSQNVNRFLVFGAGVPTLGAPHEAVPNGNVLYSDIDPENVEIGQTILAANPRCDYVYCDVTDLSTLDQARMNAVLGAEGPLGMSMAGIAAFLEDDVLMSAFEQLFDMAPPNSYLAVDVDSFGMPYTIKRRKYIRRALDEIPPLLGPWQPTPHGILPISLWPAAQIAVQDSGEPVSHYGVVLTK